jgi:chromosome condensin MukBEF complex kleisin-like MukF subunit
MIERKLDEYGLQKVVPDSDVLADAYREFHRSHQLREKFEEMVEEFDKAAKEVEVPADLGDQVRTKLAEHPELRWDDAVQLVLDPDDLDRVREDKEEAKRKSGDFTSDSDDDEIDTDQGDSRGDKEAPR